MTVRFIFATIKKDMDIKKPHYFVRFFKSWLKIIFQFQIVLQQMISPRMVLNHQFFHPHQ